MEDHDLQYLKRIFKEKGFTEDEIRKTMRKLQHFFVFHEMNAKQLSDILTKKEGE